MPELPEVEALRRFLVPRCVGAVVDHAQVVGFACLKTAGIAVSELRGKTITEVIRRGKFLCVRIGEAWLVTHLARAGWLAWRDPMPTTPARPGRGPLAFRLVLTTDSTTYGFDLTEAGTRQRLAIWLVEDLGEVPGIATLGPEPLDEAFTAQVFSDILNEAAASQIKGVLRNQRVIAGVGNAYSDEILWEARMSPFAAANRLDTAARETLYLAIRTTLLAAIERAEGLAAGALKSEKKAGLQVHGRTGQSCPRCKDTIREVSYADSSFQYCPACQTSGKVLADRRMSRLLK